jgi:hypothetical protein
MTSYFTRSNQSDLFSPRAGSPKRPKFISDASNLPTLKENIRMESDDRNLAQLAGAVKDYMFAAEALALGNAHLNKINRLRVRRIEHRSLVRIIRAIFSRKDELDEMDITAAREWFLARERMEAAHHQVEQIIAPAVPPPPSYQRQTDTFRRALMSNVLVS